nr:hypothetical protein CTI12_AA467070 [Tanacetum cinerariifolium]
VMSSCENITYDTATQLLEVLYEARDQIEHSKPMPWVGMYIALASVFCVVAVGADLIRGLWNRKLWFPCKFFTLNAASLTIIAIATKLPVDLNNSMPALVTLTTIAVSLPKIQNETFKSFVKSVREGLAYVTDVEENLNATDDYIRTQKAAKMLWEEVDIHHKWLGNNLKKHAPEVNAAAKILRWFNDTAKNKVTEEQSKYIVGQNVTSIHQYICANSLYRITKTILSYHTNIDEVSQEDLYKELSSMISDILAACLTNLPQVIATKCHEDVIDKRASSVHAAAQLLGRTTQIINRLHERELPRLKSDELPFIDKWRSYYKPPAL